MSRALAASIAGIFTFLVGVGIHSGVASAVEAEEAPTELDDGVVRWLMRLRWWRQVPEEPAVPALSEISYDGVTVSWTAPESAVFEIFDYDVQYRVADADEFIAWTHDGAVTEATISGLEEVTEYEVRVRAENEVGESDWSATASVTTLLAPPRFLEGESADRAVEENTAAGEAIGEPIAAMVREGDLRYSLEGEDADAFAIDASSGQLRTRQGVEYDHETRSSYAVEVEASHAQAGTARIVVRVMVLDVDEPPGKPLAPTVSAHGPTGLRVNWDAPVNTGPAISGYDVEYRTQGAEDYLETDHGGTDTQATISGLAPDMLYEVRVRAENDEGIGAWSNVSQGRTGRRPPPPPPPPSKAPDLVVESASVDDPIVDGGEPITLSATVRNRGDAAAEATMLRYYRSPNANISTTDTQFGSSSVEALAAGDTSNESVRFSAPSSAGTYYYGACVDSVTGESSTDNNCSTAVELTVKSQVPPVAPADQRAFDALFVGAFLSTPSYFIAFTSSGRFLELDQDWGDYTYENTGPNTGTVTQTYDDNTKYGGSCTVRMTFVSTNAGSLSYTCAGRQSNTEDWRRDTVDLSSFNIELVWSGSRSSAVTSAVRAAVSRWQSVISGNIVAAYVSVPDFFGIIDDLRIRVRVESIDGPLGTLGSAGPRIVRSNSKLPAISSIRLDQDDVSRISTSDLENLVLHEMAHALGFSAAVWGDLGLLNNPASGGTSDPLPDTHFDGAKAIAAFDSAGGASYTGEKVPVENMGGSGAVNSHWRTSVFGGELMVATFASGRQYPLSAITVQSMADIGYPVNAGAADGYALPSTNVPTTFDLATTGTLDDGLPLKCIVLEPVMTDEVTVIELKSHGHL